MTTRTVVQISKHGSFLGTRALGAKVRDEIVKSCINSQHVTLDFSGVDAMSHSFADECIGGLLTELGTAAFKAKIRFKDTNDEMDSLLRLVTSRRVHAAKPTQYEQPA